MATKHTLIVFGVILKIYSIMTSIWYDLRNHNERLGGNIEGCNTHVYIYSDLHMVLLLSFFDKKKKFKYNFHLLFSLGVTKHGLSVQKINFSQKNNICCDMQGGIGNFSLV